MSEPLVLTFDLGTQSTRAMLIDSNGEIRSFYQKKHEKPYHSRQPNWAEQSADFYWESIAVSCRKLREQTPELFDDIAAMTVTTIRDTCVCVDENGVPLRDFILWCDQRQAVDHQPFPFMKNLLFTLSGMKQTAKMQKEASACNWIMMHEKDTWAKTYKFLLLSGYLNFRLTENYFDSTANIIAHLPFDNKKRNWMKANDLKRCIFDVNTDKLSELVDPGEIIGYVTCQAARETGIPEGLPLIATGSDKGCETIGLSCCTSDAAAVSFGTTATIQFTMNRYVEPQLFFPAYPSVVKGRYNPEIQIFRGYWLISWFKKEFAQKEVVEAKALNISPETILNRRLSEIPPGCDGLLLQPFFTPGLSRPDAKGAIIGFSDHHTRIHIYRAIIEGINFALIEGMKQMERRSGYRIKRLFLAGGGSQSAEICQITADMFNLPVYRVQTNEVSGLGSSMIAFVTLKVHKDIEEATRRMVRISSEFLPNRATHRIYNDLYHQIYVRIYDQLKPLYKKQRTIKKEVDYV